MYVVRIEIPDTFDPMAYFESARNDNNTSVPGAFRALIFMIIKQFAYGARVRVDLNWHTLDCYHMICICINSQRSPFVWGESHCVRRGFDICDSAIGIEPA